MKKNASFLTGNYFPFFTEEGGVTGVALQAELASLWVAFPAAVETTLRLGDPLHSPHQVEVQLAEAANNLLTVISGDAVKEAGRWAQSVYERARDCHPETVAVSSALEVFRADRPLWIRPEELPADWRDLASALTVYYSGPEGISLQDFLCLTVDRLVIIRRKGGLRGTANPIFRTAVIHARETENIHESALETLALAAHEASHIDQFWRVIDHVPQAAVAVTLQERNAFLLESLILQEGIRLLNNRHLLDPAAELRLVDRADALMEGALACNRILGFHDEDREYHTDLLVPLVQAQEYPATIRPIGKLPSHVQISFRTAEMPSHDPLDPAEEALLSPQASALRRKQFGMGRVAAREALSRLLRADPPPLLRGSLGEPLWPEGVVASLSHTDDLAVTIASRREQSRALGVDVERMDVKFNSKLASKICTPSERAWVLASGSESAECLRLIWCAKEALYKALFPLTGEVRGFLDAAVTLRRRSSKRWEFTAELQKDWGNGFGQGYKTKVYVRTVGHHLLAWVEIPQPFAHAGAKGHAELIDIPKELNEIK